MKKQFRVIVDGRVVAYEYIAATGTWRYVLAKDWPITNTFRDTWEGAYPYPCDREQFTGTLDDSKPDAPENGVEIYEGDKVDCDGNEGTVLWHSGFGCWGVLVDEGTVDQDVILWHDIEAITVISRHEDTREEPIHDYREDGVSQSPRSDKLAKKMADKDSGHEGDSNETNWAAN